MQINRIGFAKTNDNSIKQHSKNAINSETKPDTEYSKYSTNNLKANYLVNFKGNLSREYLSTDNANAVNHETRFFREPYTDEIVQNYILDNFSNDSEINIISGACSTGEEAKSYAMMLDSLGNRLNVFGFDISDDAIKQADSKKVKLLLDTDYCSWANPEFAYEKFLTEKNLKKLTPYQRLCQDKFITYFDKISEPYKIPFLSEDEQKELNELDKKAREDMDSLNNVETMKYYDLSNKFRCHCVYQDYRAKDGAFDNCTFEQGNIQKLEQLYKPSSVNVLLYRNALYHTLCDGDGIRVVRDNAQATMNDIAKQMNKVVKEGGLVVFGENETREEIGGYYPMIETSMKSNGFKKLTQNGEELDNVWVKVEDLNENE